MHPVITTDHLCAFATFYLFAGPGRQLTSRTEGDWEGSHINKRVKGISQSRSTCILFVILWLVLVVQKKDKLAYYVTIQGLFLFYMPKCSVTDSCNALVESIA